MMSKKTRRLYGRMQHGLAKKQQHVAELEAKRDAKRRRASTAEENINVGEDQKTPLVELKRSSNTKKEEQEVMQTDTQNGARRSTRGRSMAKNKNDLPSTRDPSPVKTRQRTRQTAGTAAPKEGPTARRSSKRLR